MTSILDVLEKQVATHRWVSDPSWTQYISTGDEQYLATLPRFSTEFDFPDELLSALPGPDRIDESGKRFLRACIKSQHPSAMGRWLMQCSAQDDMRGEQFNKGCDLLLSLGASLPVLAEQVSARMVRFRNEDGSPTAPWRLMLRLDDMQVRQLVQTFSSALQSWFLRKSNEKRLNELVILFATHAADRWATILGGFTDPVESKLVPSSVWIASLRVSASAFVEKTAEAFERMPVSPWKLELGITLAEIDPARYGTVVETLAREAMNAVEPNSLGPIWENAKTAALWLVENRAPTAMATLTKYMVTLPSREHWRGHFIGNAKNSVLDLAVQKLNRDAIPLLDATYETEQPFVQLQAFQHWGTIKLPEDTEHIVALLRHLLANKDSVTVSRAIRLAGAMRMDALEGDLWAQLAHKSKPVREAAAVTMAQLGDSRLPKATELWKVRRADPRLAAVSWLRALGTPGAITALKARLTDEEDDGVRDAILLALESTDDGASHANPEELRARIAKTLLKIDGPPVAWLDLKMLPAAKLTDGATLSPDTLRYLLYRQSRVKEMRADIEARPLFRQIDHATSGDLAVAVLQAYFKSEMDADDRWAMAFAALIGDDRLVPLFARQVKAWADGLRGKLAEHAVQALALLGTDSALVAVDAMANRYRTKNRNIGQAASDAFTRAAESRGVTVEELGDLVVPWLGFSPGEQRIVDTAKAKIDVRVGSDFKVIFRDVATNKKVAKLPPGASKEVQAELKELAAGLKEAAKAQLLRMETLVVRQFRWPLAQWKQLYLQHPLLVPFSQRLVWGAYDAAGRLVGTFRALEDRSTTGADDEPYEIPSDSAIGIVHPLELTAEERQRWITHLADYDVVPPFAQLERIVVTASHDERAVRFGNQSADTKLNGMTFKGRAERLGWSRGSVCDGGGIPYYLKTFPGAGVDVFVEIAGMYVGIGTDSDVMLGRTFFVKHGSVRIGSYIYDEPTDANDPRLLAYGDVPPIAFSEALGDLGRISGNAQGEQTETT